MDLINPVKVLNFLQVVYFYRHCVATCRNLVIAFLFRYSVPRWKNVIISTKKKRASVVYPFQHLSSLLTVLPAQPVWTQALASWVSGLPSAGAGCPPSLHSGPAVSTLASDGT